MNKRVFFYNADISYNVPNKGILRNKIAQLADNEGFMLSNLNIILCSDNHLLEINKKHLNHSYYTDVITFDLSENEKEIDGEIYVSLDRVRINKKIYNVSLLIELQRVILHGVLHLVGYDDHNEKDISIMRKKEQFYLGL